VVGVAIVRDGRALAARRTYPAAAVGRWELPGGKTEPGEEVADAAVREVAEELGCRVRVTGRLAGEQPVGGHRTLVVVLAELVGGEPAPVGHDALRWLGPEEIGDLDWLAPDLPFLAELREVLLDGRRLEGGNVGGAVRVGHTVRRTTGAWTPAVHRLLDHVRRSGLRAVPEVLGVDARGREALTYLRGEVVDVDRDRLTDAQLADVASWARELHERTAGLEIPGPWRFFDVAAVPGARVLAHNDLAPYNLCFCGDRLTGVFDWDLAGPSTPLLELAHLAWNGVPLFRPLPADEAARRLRVIAEAYGEVAADSLLRAVPGRVRLAVDGIRAALAAGDPLLGALALVGEPERTERALSALLPRLPGIERALASAPPAGGRGTGRQ
jgi:8-oxo-dGTP pyrophosphatase MutT (NUDIX family)